MVRDTYGDTYGDTIDGLTFWRRKKYGSVTCFDILPPSMKRELSQRQSSHEHNQEALASRRRDSEAKDWYALNAVLSLSGIQLPTYHFLPQKQREIFL